MTNKKPHRKRNAQPVRPVRTLKTTTTSIKHLLVHFYIIYAILNMFLLAVQFRT